MTSWYGNAFCVTGHLCWEYIGHQWNLSKNGQCGKHVSAEPNVSLAVLSQCFVALICNASGCVVHGETYKQSQPKWVLVRMHRDSVRHSSLVDFLEKILTAGAFWEAIHQKITSLPLTTFKGIYICKLSINYIILPRKYNVSNLQCRN